MCRTKLILSAFAFSIALAGALSLGLSSSARAEPTSAVAEVLFKARPWAKVTVDGRSVGTTPARVKLGAGVHKAVFARSKQRVERTFTVVAGQPMTVMAEMGALRVPPHKPRVAPHGKTQATFKARPWAKVSVDGKVVGTTPLRVDLSPGRHEVTFQRGQLRLTRLVNAKLGEPLEVFVTMEK